MYVDAVIMEVQVLVGMCHFAEWAYLHPICDFGYGEGRNSVAVMEPLSFHTSVLVLIQLLSPVYYLMGNERSNGTFETDYLVGWLVGVLSCYERTVPSLF